MSVLRQSGRGQARCAIKREQRIDDDLRLPACKAIDVEAVVTLKCTHALLEACIENVQIRWCSAIAIIYCREALP